MWQGKVTGYGLFEESHWELLSLKIPTAGDPKNGRNGETGNIRLTSVPFAADIFCSSGLNLIQRSLH